MKTIVPALLLLLCCTAIQAQQKFTGTIEYKIVLFKDMAEQEQPVKVIMAYGKDKMSMRASFKDKPDEFLILNTLTDSVYMTNNGTNTYTKESLTRKGSAGMDIKFERTDSFKTYFSYPCRGYRVESEKTKESYGYVWVAEDFYGIPLKDNYQHFVLTVTGAPYVMLSTDMYNDKGRMGAYIPVDIKKMDEVPESYFDLTGYTETKWDDAELMPDTARVLSAEDYPPADTTSVAPVKVKPAKKTIPVKKTPVKKQPGQAKPAATKPKQ